MFQTPYSHFIFFVTYERARQASVTYHKAGTAYDWQTVKLVVLPPILWYKENEVL
jgi:hypothetical protein